MTLKCCTPKYCRDCQNFVWLVSLWLVIFQQKDYLNVIWTMLWFRKLLVYCLEICCLHHIFVIWHCGSFPEASPGCWLCRKQARRRQRTLKSDCILSKPYIFCISVQNIFAHTTFRMYFNQEVEVILSDQMQHKPYSLKNCNVSQQSCKLSRLKKKLDTVLSYETIA